MNHAEANELITGYVDPVIEDLRSIGGKWELSPVAMLDGVKRALLTDAERNETLHPKGRDCLRAEEVLENYKTRALSAERAFLEVSKGLRKLADGISTISFKDDDSWRQATDYWKAAIAILEKHDPI